MSEKEKLQEIIDNEALYVLNGLEFSVRGEVLNWLIEQAERAQELDEYVYGINETYRQEREYNERLQQENKRLREAFENARKQAVEDGACKADEDIPDDDKEEAYRLGAEDMLNDFTDFYRRQLGVSE